MAWREAYSLRDLRLQLNAAYPKRNKISDGGIGDARHAADPSSDHNPHLRGADGMQVYSARDFTHDPATGIDCNWLAQTLVKNKDPRIKYIIWDGRICSSKVAAWTWRPYNGVNKHNKHLHISVDANLFDKPGNWRLDFPTPVYRIVESDIARVTEPQESIAINAPADKEGTVSSAHCLRCGVAYDTAARRFNDDLCPDCGKAADEADRAAAAVAEAERIVNAQALPDQEPKGETATGGTSGEPPKTEVQPTKLKGYYAAILGFIATNVSVAATWYAGLPDIVQASIFVGGGIATGALILGVIWIKNAREERANQKDLAIIKAKG